MNRDSSINDAFRASIDNAFRAILERLRAYKPESSNIGVTTRNAEGNFLSTSDMLEFTNQSPEDEIEESQELNDFLSEFKVIKEQEVH